jgi:hypothetical protein
VKTETAISISFPFGGVIVGVFWGFPGSPARRQTLRETPENLDSTTGGPNGKHMLVNWPDLGDFALAGEAVA